MAFNASTFYTFNSSILPSYTLSAGIFLGSNGAINMTELGSLSSENWQIFPQGGRYFIRNYDYGAKYQLGLTEQDRSVPKLYPRSGSLAQQWSIIQRTGGWELVNGLWGNGTWLALSGPFLVAPAMNSGETGRLWNITSNPSAEASGPKGAEMYSEVEGFELSQSSSSSILGSSSTASASASPSGTSVTPSALPTLTAAPPSSSPSLSAGAIAGIAIGGVAVLAAIIFAAWFLIRKRRLAKERPYGLHGDSGPSEKYAYQAELETPRAELESPRQVWEKDPATKPTELP